MDRNDQVVKEEAEAVPEIWLSVFVAIVVDFAFNKDS
jgi:hypothetical protein